jgi:hypothetical protein
MDEIRKGSIESENLRHAFLAKLLNGDGSLDTRMTPKRLDVRVKIVDQNLSYLSDYADILRKEGFKAKVLADRITVRAYCTWLNLLHLYRINAFRNNRNWPKLICAIVIQREGMENKGYRRIQELSSRPSFTSDDLCAIYGIGRRASNLWIGTMRRHGLMAQLPRVTGSPYKFYGVTAKGKEMSRILDAVDQEYGRISAEKGISDAREILQGLIRKGRKACLRSPTKLPISTHLP